MLKYAFGSFIMALAFIAGFILWRTGYFKEVSISSASKGPMVLVYREHFGPYHKIPPVIEGVEKTLSAMGAPCDLAFGRYLDDPNTVDHDRLRSQGGCILSQIPESQKEAWAKSDLLTLALPKKEYILATFNGSPSIGPLKVYPKVESWMEKYGYKMAGPAIELYKTLPDNTVLTTYLFEYTD